MLCWNSSQAEARNSLETHGFKSFKFQASFRAQVPWLLQVLATVLGDLRWSTVPCWFHLIPFWSTMHLSGVPNWVHALHTLLTFSLSTSFSVSSPTVTQDKTWVQGFGADKDLTGFYDFDFERLKTFWVLWQWKNMQKDLKKVKNQNGDWGNGLWPSCNPVSAVSFFHQHFGPRTSFLDIWTGRGRAAEWPGMAPQQLSGFQKASWNQQMARPGNSLAAGSRVWRDSP